MLAERFGIGPDDVVGLSMPMFHSNAMIAGWSVALAGGASMVLRRKFSASGFVADVRRHGVTYANYVGKPLNYILATPESPDDASSSLRIMYGNEASAADRERFAARFGCRVVDGFGSTEGGVAITRTPDTPPDALGPMRSPVAVVNPDTGAPTRIGEIGEIVNTSGPGLFSGYYNDPDATAERMRGGIYHTGDLAWSMTPVTSTSPAASATGCASTARTWEPDPSSEFCCAINASARPPSSVSLSRSATTSRRCW